MIMMETRLFPQASEQFVTKEMIDPSSPGSTVRAQLPVPELKRWHAHIRLIDLTHPLLSVACKCLRDKENERLSLQQICRILSTSKTQDKISAAMKNEEMELLKSQLNDKDEQLTVCRSEIQHLEENLE